MTATPVLHADVDSFFASVAVREDPSLRGKPVIVGSGVVMAATYEAKARGVRGGMGGAKARRLCPDAVFVDPSFSSYTRASRELFEIFRRTSPRVQGGSLEEAFLDVSGLERIAGEPREIAARLRAQVRDELGLPISVGVARTKVLAKMASRAAKPNGLVVVDTRSEAAFLRPLPIGEVWGIGAASARKLTARGIDTVGDAAEASETELISILGRHSGRFVHRVANNLDVGGRVHVGRGRRSFGSQRAGSSEPPDATLLALADRVSGRMRKAGRHGRTVTLRVRFGDFQRASRSFTMPRYTAASEDILMCARTLFASARPQVERRGLTLIGLSVSNLDGEGAGEQLTLPLERRSAELDGALDELRERFGSAAVRRGGEGAR